GVPARRSLLGAQTGEHLVEECQRPATLEKEIGAEMVGRFERVTLLGGQRVERNKRRASAAFQGLRFVPFVRQKALERDEEEGTEASLRLICRAQVILFE